MTVYGIAHITITDTESYDRYTPDFMPILRQYDGTLLVADDKPRVVEGEPTAEKVVVVSFEDEAAFDRWYNSREYQAILGHRLAAAKGPLVLTRGVRPR